MTHLPKPNKLKQGMSSQAVLRPFKAPSTSQQASSIVVTPMSVDDIPPVMAIERTSFPRPWPERAYRYELSENPNAHFVVARADVRSEGSFVTRSSQWHKITRFFRPQRRTLVVAPRPLVIGFAGMWMYVDEAHIATIATHPDWRGRGIGELILLHLMREAQRRNATTVTLEVRVSNRVAQSLYRKYGFEEVGYRKAYYHDNREDALLMTVTRFTEPGYEAHLDHLEHNLHIGE